MSTLFAVLAIMLPYAIAFVALVALVTAIIWLAELADKTNKQWFHERGFEYEDYDKSHR